MNYDLWKCTDELAEYAAYREAMEDHDVDWKLERERRKAEAFLDNQE